MPLPHTARTHHHQARLIWSLALLSLLSLVIGCSQRFYEKQFVAPAQDQTCLARCALLKTQCQQRQETRERECGEWYTAARKDYDLCKSGGTDNCKAPTTCLGADLGICDQEYEGCFTACGGRIERRLRPWPGARSPDAAKPPAADQPSAPAG